LVEVSYPLMNSDSLIQSTHRFAPEQKAQFSLIDAVPYRSPMEKAPFGLKSWVTLKQVHGVEGVHQTIDSLQHQVQADWHYTHDLELGLAIFIADCTALLMRGKNANGEFVAALHAGWRGTAAGIIEKAMEEISPMGELYVWLSPSICQKHYEVSESVIEKFPKTITPFLWPSRPKHYYLDLKAYQRSLLQGYASKVWSSPLCTFCQPEFFSYRRSESKLDRRHFAWVALRI